MARKKKTPIRRCLDENGGEEVRSEIILGHSHMRDSQSLDYMLASEIARNIEEKEQQEKNSTKTTMPPTLASIELKIAARERNMSSTTAQRKKKATNSKKGKPSSSKEAVHFAPILDSEIPPPELIIERCVDNNNNIDGDYQRLLHFCPRKKLLPSHGNSNNRTILSSFNLTRTKIIMEGITSERKCAQHLVVTGIAIREFWKEYTLPNQFQFLTSLIKCLEKDWIQLVLYSPNEEDLSPSLNIILTQHAFENCSNLPLTQQYRQHKKYATSNYLQYIIKALFGILKGAPICSKDKSTDEISAKRVYNLVDNKQLEQYTDNNADANADDKKQFPTLNIEGLLPTLRPYQAAAVKWMIEREHVTTHGDEWKVTWTVLDSTTRTTTPLVQLKGGKDTEITGPFYCPFNGRIARTVQEAKQITLMGQTHPIRGGILAEQMGLGKTIEVLALILANPHAVIPLERSNGRPACRRQLIFEDDSSTKNNRKNESRENMGVNSDLLEFGGTDDSLEDDVNSVEQTRNNFDVTSRINTIPAAVTPDTVMQRWFDSSEVGSCICGDLICFSGKSKKMKIVFCESCEEPMHLECTCLELVDMEKLPRLDLRRTFGNEKLECVLCKDCPCCFPRKNIQPIRSRATIIICPPSILEQWEQEIKRHTKQMKVLIYSGVEKESRKSRSNPAAMRLLHPSYMADTDIILVSFVALMSDLSHSEENRFAFQSTDGNRSSNLRKRKKYRVVPSPLLSIHFWRVCIDEAQRVEVTTTKAAKMALKLNAEYFWAVSGTPIGSGKLQDLYGLFLFLGLAPFNNREWFDSCLSSSAIEGVDDRIQLILSQIFWRSTKELESVKNQIGIPDMREERIVLKFSSIERHFYSIQLEKTMQLATNFKDRDIAGERKRKAGLDYLSESLHRLRAACCHPQVGANGIGGVAGRKFKKSRSRPSRSGNESGNSVASRVMTMEQILDRLIDDARRKCEEAQRLAILHTNGMAGISRLKVKARGRGVEVDEDDRSLLMKSGELYRESLLLAQRNAIATKANSEATLTGNTGFCFPNQTFRDGKCVLMWKMQQDFNKVWSKVEYVGSSRKIVKLRIRPIVQLPADIQEENSNDFKWHLVVPTSVVLQVATVSTEGEFVDCAEASLENNDNDWVDVGNIRRTNKSKMWRIVVENSKSCDQADQSSSSIQSCGYYVGLEIELYEPQINSDDIQSLHALHNACLSYEAAIRIPSDRSETESNEEIMSHIKTMKQTKKEIESLHKVHSQTLHKTCMIKLDGLTRIRDEKEKQLYDKTQLTKKKVKDCWDDGWFDDFLGIVCLYGSETQKNVIFDRIVQDVEGIYNADDTMKFPDFNSLTGLKTALSMRISKIRCDGLGNKHEMLPATTADNGFVQVRSTRFKCGRGEHRSCMSQIHNLSPNPDSLELHENSQCRLCKADWNQTGKICRHCGIAAILQDLKPDSVTITVLTAIFASIRSPTGMALLISTQTSHVAQRARYFFEVLEAEEREKIGANRMWRAHLDLLNGFDELVSCKQSLRLSLENEDLTLLTEEQLNAIVLPIDLLSQYYDHEAKQGMHLGELRRATGTLRYLQNQNTSSGEETSSETCVVCLRHFHGEMAVLRCGHRFHQKPCFDQILSRSSGTSVQCPMKCREKTAKNEVMIATNKASDDGSNVARKIKGSYGTKISRIISDILTIRDKGEKGVIFSQWNDMLDILESALIENDVAMARPHGGRGFSESLRSFQSPNCTVLLLNLKQGAEGLTLVHATHVFMVEPIINNGLDQQAINRIHRIGQTKKTFVWRYLIEDTIEMKLDKMRLKHQGGNDVLEDSMNSMRNSMFALGGIDGGISSQEELLEILD
jgi:SNF2 family DNA or RNA helicase